MEGSSRSKQTLQPRETYKPKPSPALSTHSVWGGSDRQKSPSVEEKPLPSRIMATTQEVATEQQDRKEVSSVEKPLSALSVQQSPHERKQHSYLSQRRSVREEFQQRHKEYMGIATRVTRHPLIWHDSDSDFASKVSRMTSRELAQAGRLTTQDDRFTRNVMTNLEPKLQAFYREVYHRLERPDSETTLEWLDEIMRPLEHGGYYNDALMERICQHISRRVNFDRPVSLDSAAFIAKIITPMIWTGFFDPMFIETAWHYTKGFHFAKPKNLKRSMNFARTLSIMHAMPGHSCRDYHRLSRHIQRMVECINKQAHHIKECKYKVMHHQINLYSRFVLNLDVQLPPPVRTVNEGTVSQFQKSVEKILRASLPGVVIEAEAILPRIELSVDVFILPNIVVEADGKYAHFSEELLLDEKEAAAGFSDEYLRHREKGKYIMKRRILEGAGYVVFNITNHTKETMDDLVQRIKALQAKKIQAEEGK